MDKDMRDEEAERSFQLIPQVKNVGRLSLTAAQATNG